MILGNTSSVDVSIVIVNWNSKDFLRECIASIPAGAGRLNFEIIVIDSGSFDGCQSVLYTSGSPIRFIQSEANIGFARANNQAFAQSLGEYLLFLNPDTILFPGALERLYTCLHTRPSAGIAGPKLLNADGSVQTTCVRAFPTIFNQLLETEIFRRWFPLSRLWGMRALFLPTAEPVSVDVVSGACMMMRRSLFEMVGKFSDDYFMYSEDIDLCFKALQTDRKTYYVPSALVTHFGGKSSARSSINAFAAVMMLESRWRYFVKTRSRIYANAYRAAMLLSSVTRIGCSALVWPIAAFVGGGDAIEGAIRKWSARLLWSIGGQRWVKGAPPNVGQ
jgi:N-acetylglucosaminyl-diphospho-decaprenol L-rhamnosyltransferase